MTTQQQQLNQTSMYQSSWMEQLMRLYLKPGHYTLYNYVLTNAISHPKQTQDQPHISHILESEDCKQWAMTHIPRSNHGLIFDKDYGRVIGQCGNKNYIKSLVETQIDPHGHFISDLLHGIVRHQPLELIQWLMSITQKQQDAFPGVFSIKIIHTACRYRRPDVLIFGFTLPCPSDRPLILFIACQMSIDNNDISCLDVLRRDRHWDAMTVFRYAASCKNHFIFTWLHRTCPLERYDDLIRQYLHISDWFKN
jgi:hypothetical protein